MRLILATALALVLQGTFTGAYATNATGHCTGMTVTDFVSSDKFDNTTSEAWVNITDGHLNFTTSATGCVSITFSGVGNIAPPSNGLADLHMRTLLDGNNLCAPALTNDLFLQGGYGNPPASANSFMRICKNVVAGTHTLQVQFRSGEGYSVWILGHQLAVTHN